MRLTLRTISYQTGAMGSDAEKVFDASGGTFGRCPDSANAMILPDPERYVSSVHGEIFFRDGNFFVTDRSTNGLGVEGRTENIGKGESLQLFHGDVLLAGEFRLQVSIDGGASAGAEMAGESNNSPFPIDLPSSDGAPGDVLAGVMRPDDLAFSAPSAVDAAPDHEHSFVPPRVVVDPAAAHRLEDGLEDGLENGREDEGSLEVAAPTPTTSPESPVESSAAPAADEPTSDGLIPEDWDEAPLPSEGEFDALHQEAEDLFASAADSVEEALPGQHSSALNDASGNPEEKQAQEASSPPSPAPAGPEVVESVAHPTAPSPEPSLAPVTAGASAAGPVPGALAPEAQPSGPDALRMFFDGLGVAPPDGRINDGELFRGYGELLRNLLASLIELLRSRAEFKNEFRLSRTVLMPVENNPLKFSPNVDEALRVFLQPASSGYLSMNDAVDEAIKDLKLHQLGMIAGLQAVFREASLHMDPQQYVPESASGVKAIMQSLSQNAARWEEFCEHCKKLESASAEGVAGYFSETFTKAYEEKIRSLESAT
ncbi:MAG: type VI secretion system-associated FHA domain protein TagH [Pseudomonadota bacterium]